MTRAPSAPPALASHQRTRHSARVRYEPAIRLLQLALCLSGTRLGLSLDDMAQELGVGRRTAERLRDSLEQIFPQISYSDGDDRIRRWRLPPHSLPALPIQPGVIATLETLARERTARDDHARAADLHDAITTLRALMPPTALSRAEPDIEALMQAEGTAANPGPKLKLDRALLANLRRAILGMTKLRLKYHPAEASRASTRTLCPYAILYGRRAYLIAHTDTTPDLRLWRIDRITNLTTLPDSFERQPFDLTTYAAQSFGVFQEPPKNITLRFTPEAAPDAAEWLFHPSQTVTPQPDGSLLVTFRAGGLRELDWHLYTWGDAVELTINPPRQTN